MEKMETYQEAIAMATGMETISFTLFAQEQDSNIRKINMPVGIVHKYGCFFEALTDEKASVLLTSAGCNGENNTSFTDDEIEQKLFDILKEKIEDVLSPHITIEDEYQNIAVSYKEAASSSVMKEDNGIAQIRHNLLRFLFDAFPYYSGKDRMDDSVYAFLESAMNVVDNTLELSPIDLLDSKTICEKMFTLPDKYDKSLVTEKEHILPQKALIFLPTRELAKAFYNTYYSTEVAANWIDSWGMYATEYRNKKCGVVIDQNIYKDRPVWNGCSVNFPKFSEDNYPHIDVRELL